MLKTLRSRHRVTRFSLWFGLLGSSVAWFAHLVAVWGIVEIACIAGLPGFPGVEVLGVPGVIVVMLLIVTALTLLVALASGLVAYLNREALREHGDAIEAPVSRGAGRYMTHGGIYLCFVYVFIILVETIPVFIVPPCI